MREIEKLLRKHGTAMDIKMEDRRLWYSPVLDEWIVRRWQGRSPKNILYQGSDFETALSILIDNGEN